MGCLGGGMLGMFWMWDVRDLGCSGCRMFGIWDMGYGVFLGMWDNDLQNAVLGSNIFQKDL